MPWDDTSSSTLRTVSVHEREHLETLPGTWSAAEMSSFICQRPDWPYLASVYMCLWKEVADRDPDAKENVARLASMPPSVSPTHVQSPLLDAARRAMQTHGIALHPRILMQDIRAYTPPGDSAPGCTTARAATKPRKERGGDMRAVKKKQKQNGSYHSTTSPHIPSTTPLHDIASHTLTHRLTFPARLSMM